MLTGSFLLCPGPQPEQLCPVDAWQYLDAFLLSPLGRSYWRLVGGGQGRFSTRPWQGTQWRDTVRGRPHKGLYPYEFPLAAATKDHKPGT